MIKLREHILQAGLQDQLLLPEAGLIQIAEQDQETATQEDIQEAAMDRGQLKGEPGVAAENILIHRQVEHTHHQAGHIRLQPGVTLHLLGAEAVPEERQAEEAAQVAAEAEEGNKMKKCFLTTAFLTLLGMGLTGCYTVIWNPSENNFPTKEDTNNENGYYSNEYYGPYADFYGSPWWYNVTPPGYIDKSNPVDKESGTIIRDAGGRGQQTRGLWNIITAEPPARTSPRTTDVTKSSTNVNSNTGSTTSTRIESSRSSQSSTNTRNDNGSRNTDTGRKR